MNRLRIKTLFPSALLWSIILLKFKLKDYVCNLGAIIRTDPFQDK